MSIIVGIANKINILFQTSFPILQAGHLYTQMQKTGDFRLSGNLPFCLLGALAPKPLFRRLHLRLRTVPALFSKHTVRQSRPVSSKSCWRIANVPPADAVSPLPQIRESGAKSHVWILHFQNSYRLLSAARGGNDLVVVKLATTKINGSNWFVDSRSVSKRPNWPLEAGKWPQ